MDDFLITGVINEKKNAMTAYPLKKRCLHSYEAIWIKNAGIKKEKWVVIEKKSSVNLLCDKKVVNERKRKRDLILLLFFFLQKCVLKGLDAIIMGGEEKAFPFHILSPIDITVVPTPSLSRASGCRRSVHVSDATTPPPLFPTSLPLSPPHYWNNSLIRRHHHRHPARVPAVVLHLGQGICST